MKVIQILPELNSGGVERGTLEVAEHLVRQGHESLVVSNGGRLVQKLEAAGSRHVQMPVHRKALRSLGQIPRLRKLFVREKPDILHLRSRLPAWLAYLAWLSLPRRSRPRLVTTVHGFYSVNAYSRVMTRGERIITVSNSVRDYVLRNYPETKPDKIAVIHRGIEEGNYSPDFVPSDEWMSAWKAEVPALNARIPLLMPGRLTRWKGQEDFLKLIADLIARDVPVHGLIAGGPHPKKIAYQAELRSLADHLGVTPHVTFLGDRTDLREIMSVSRIVYSLSHDPEAFGRVSLEAMALGKPVIAYSHGGVAEQLEIMFPQGLAPVNDLETVADLTIKILNQNSQPAPSQEFALSKMLGSTLRVYHSLLSSPRTQ